MALNYRALVEMLESLGPRRLTDFARAYDLLPPRFMAPPAQTTAVAVYGVPREVSPEQMTQAVERFNEAVDHLVFQNPPPRLPLPLWLEEVQVEFVPVDRDTDALRASQRSIAGLREWLSPEQRADYDCDGYFFVQGGLTGRPYRIRHDTVFNVDEIDDLGKVTAKLCFGPAPQGGFSFPLGDVLLQQKLALVHNESEALRIANRARRLSLKDGDVVRVDWEDSFFLDPHVPIGTKVTVIRESRSGRVTEHSIYVMGTCWTCVDLMVRDVTF